MPFPACVRACLSAEECDELIKAATPRLQRSIIAVPENGSAGLSEQRTSNGGCGVVTRSFSFWRQGGGALRCHPMFPSPQPPSPAVCMAVSARDGHPLSRPGFAAHQRCMAKHTPTLL